MKTITNAYVTVLLLKNLNLLFFFKTFFLFLFFFFIFIYLFMAASGLSCRARASWLWHVGSRAHGISSWHHLGLAAPWHGLWDLGPPTRDPNPRPLHWKADF